MEPSKAVNDSQGSESRRQMQRCGAAVDHLFGSEGEHTQCPVTSRPITESGKWGTQHVAQKGQTLATLLSIYIIFPCVWFYFGKRQRKKQENLCGVSRKSLEENASLGESTRKTVGTKKQLFAMFKTQQISPRKVLKRGTPKCIFSTLFHHLHIYFFLAYLDFKNMFSPGQNVRQILIKQTNKQQQTRLYILQPFPNSTLYFYCFCQ